MADSYPVIRYEVAVQSPNRLVSSMSWSHSVTRSNWIIHNSNSTLLISMMLKSVDESDAT